MVFMVGLNVIVVVSFVCRCFLVVDVGCGV